MIQYLVFCIGKFLTILPRICQCFLGQLIGSTAWMLLSRRRRIAIANLRMAGFEKDAIRLSLKSFQHMGMNLIEVLLLPHLEKLSPWLIYENQKDLCQNPKGVVLLAAHIGNWELMGTYARLGAPIFGLYRPQKLKWVDELLYWLRSQTGMSLLSSHQSLKDTYRVLKDGKVLGNVGDQGQGLKLQFMGRETNFPEGPVRLAHRTDSRLLFYACLREGKYLRMKLVSEIVIDSENLYNAMQDFAITLENLIRIYPEQYFWVHDIWKEFRRKKS
ncbi:MAG: hypothetical protein H3C47_05530 [Candidatus Cloacimonetes bacterium]|nr:hypothetical protein [Candidatus Cloacimonadota bacterium]